jgi:GNAT superfamily N-acetyltransferase
MPPIMRTLLQRQGHRITSRSFDRKKRQQELETMRSIFNDAWSRNWSFVPFTEAEFQAVGKELLSLLPNDFIRIAEVDGMPAAFIVLLPNINEAIGDLDGRLMPLGWVKLVWRLKVRSPKSGRIALMGVRQEFQRTRLGPALAFLTIESLEEPARRRGIEKVEMSWVLESNKGTRNIIEQIGGRITSGTACMPGAGLRAA